MRTPLWESSPGAIAALFNSGSPFSRAELLTVQLRSGTVVRFARHDVDVTVNAVLWPHTGPVFSRSNVVHKRGVEVDTMDLEVAPADTDLLDGIQWLTAIRAGALDYATITLDWCIFNIGAPTTPVGTYNWFYGQVDEVPEVGALSAKIKVVSDLSRLGVLMPRNVVQPGCLNTLFDTACGLLKTAFQFTGTVTSVGGDGSLTINHSAATDYYNEGELVITSGLNNNVVRKIKNNVGQVQYLFGGFVFPITPGTTVRLYPGCKKTKAECESSKFLNGPRFRGIPFVPAPEVVL